MFLSSLSSKRFLCIKRFLLFQETLLFQEISFISRDILYFKRFFSAFSMRSKWNSERVCSISA